MGSQQEDHFINLERRKDHEANQTPSVQVDAEYINYTSRSHFRAGSLVSYDEETRNLRLEIDHLRKKLRCKQRETSPPSLETDSDEDGSYRPRSRTPHSKSFSLYLHIWKERSGITGRKLKVRLPRAWGMM